MKKDDKKAKNSSHGIVTQTVLAMTTTKAFKKVAPYVLKPKYFWAGVRTLNAVDEAVDTAVCKVNEVAAKTKAMFKQ
jgi:hypothetical protein